MADQAKKLEEQRDSFQNEQLNPFQELADAYTADTSVDLLQLAEDLNFIRAGTRQRIEAVFPIEEDKLLFSNALSKGLNFKAAFEAVYGKFLFEHRNEELENPGGDFIKGLGKVLKFPISTEGLKNRPELMAATRRLHMAGSFAHIKEFLKKVFGGVDAKEYEIAKGNVKEAKDKHARAEEAEKYFKDKDIYSDLQTALSRFQEHSKENTNEPLKKFISRLEKEIKGFEDILSSKDTSGRFSVTDSTERQGFTKEITERSDKIEDLKTLQESAKTLHELLVTRAKHILTLSRLGIIAESKKEEIRKIVNSLSTNKPGDANFKAQDLLKIIESFAPLGDLLNMENISKGFHEKLPGLQDALEAAERELASLNERKAGLKNLTDSQAARKIIEVMLEEQFPEMPLKERGELAKLVLANDIGLIQSEEGYEELAQRATAEELDTVKTVGVKEKLIGLKFKVGDKMEQPFKNFKPEDFADWAHIERLFNTGRLNYQNGFLALAGLKSFEGDVRSIQTLNMEKKLKELLAKELGVDERMDEAGVRDIVNKAFNDQMKAIVPLVETYSAHYDNKRTEWSGHKANELRMRLKVLNEDRRLGNIEPDVYEKRYREVLNDAAETGVKEELGSFSQNSVMAGFWHSKYSQWFRDRGYNTGAWAKSKAKGLGMGGLKVAGRGLWGTTKLGLSLGVQTALTPFRILKYPLKVLAKPINLFRKNKIDALNIRKSLRNDVGRIGGYFKKKGVSTWGGTKEALKHPGEEWRKATYAKGKKYKERTKVDRDSLAKQADELKAKVETEAPIEVAEIPYIKLDKYKGEIAKLDKILANA